MFPLRLVADGPHIAIAREQARPVAAKDEVLHELAEGLAGLRTNPLVLLAKFLEHRVDALRNKDEGCASCEDDAAGAGCNG